MVSTFFYHILTFMLHGLSCSTTCSTTNVLFVLLCCGWSGVTANYLSSFFLSPFLSSILLYFFSFAFWLQLKKLLLTPPNGLMGLDINKVSSVLSKTQQIKPVWSHPKVSEVLPLSLVSVGGSEPSLCNADPANVLATSNLYMSHFLAMYSLEKTIMHGYM